MTTSNLPAITDFINEDQIALFGDTDVMKNIITRGTTEQIGKLQTVTEEHLNQIAEYNKEINRATNIFGRSQSKYMNYIFTVSAFTPLRNLQQLLAEIESRRSALRENIFKQKKQIVEFKEKEEKFNNLIEEYSKLEAHLNSLPEDMLIESYSEKSVSPEKKRNLKLKKRFEELKFLIPKLKIELEEVQSGLADSRVYIEGALRTIAQHQRAYDSILKAHNLEGWTEEDYENEEARYHVMTAFAQSMEDVYSRGGIIDKGDLIYMRQIGIHPAIATKELRTHMALMDSKMSDDSRVNAIEDHSDDMIKFLSEMADKYSHAAKKMLKFKGLDNYKDSDLMVK